jgi:tRNA threonylcarbamoyl adenosine modification protein YeaZ
LKKKLVNFQLISDNNKSTGHLYNATDNMKILGVDTTTKFLSLGIYDDGKVYEYNLEADRRLASLLSVTIKRVLDALGWCVEDIDYFACGLGPGSFTGMRVGLATIKGMSWAKKKPVIGISTLDVLASDVKVADASIVPIIDAKRNLLYCSIYENKNGRLKRIKPYMLLTAEELFRKIKGNAVLLGDAAGLYREKILVNIKGATILDRDYWYPKAHNIITLALERIKDKKPKASSDIKPIYLYPRECQVKNSNDKT